MRCLPAREAVHVAPVIKPRKMESSVSLWKHARPVRHARRSMDPASPPHVCSRRASNRSRAARRSESRMRCRNRS